MAGNEASKTLEKFIDLGHLSSGVGHHVINAFSAIVSNAELLRLDPPMPSFADPIVVAETIIRTALEASTVARRLIDYTRPVTSIEPDRSVSETDTVALDQLVADVIAAEQALESSGIVWEISLTPIPPIRGHETQLRSMIAHFLRNSYDAMPPSGGMISVSTSTDNRGWNVLELRDSGQGMDHSILERAVEPFFSTKPGRLGVGLSIANGIWRRHRGTMAIHSQTGDGTRIRLCVEPLHV